MRVIYSDTLSDGRQVEIEATYTPADYTPGQESEASGFVLHVYDYKRLGHDIRLELAMVMPRDYARLRRECLQRCGWEMDCLAGEHANVRRDAQATR
jgi:hypothetical protein